MGCGFTNALRQIATLSERRSDQKPVLVDRTHRGVFDGGFSKAFNTASIRFKCTKTPPTSTIKDVRRIAVAEKSFEYCSIFITLNYSYMSSLHESPLARFLNAENLELIDLNLPLRY